MTGLNSRRERGELEAEVMEILWDAEEQLSVNEVSDRFAGRRPNYSTIMTTLERLERKDMVVRSDPSPRKIRFAAAQSRDAYASDRMVSVLSSSGDRRATLMAFAGHLSETDLDVLRSSLQQAQTRHARKDAARAAARKRDRRRS
ncbi:BlaI/MecI/CopY family transcriptional regulator [Brevibacterium otitidis]|uniref:BlaI/MecI/CopY family transcriptional regulator n=1 Tax=Brevibacterium otitidis TaxID=53364 RepID=A0ABV5WZ37_9MICO|nr:hypothetical protein GCM10023233_14040 [Brevibacterium otitidis]